MFLEEHYRGTVRTGTPRAGGAECSSGMFLKEHSDGARDGLAYARGQSWLAESVFGGVADSVAVGRTAWTTGGVPGGGVFLEEHFLRASLVPRGTG